MKISNKNIENIIEDNMMQYANYVITSRAIPELRDGMKPVYRRILFTMHKMNAINFTKSQNVEGQVMKYHPHAGSYPTIVGMVQKDNHLTPLIEGKGNFAQRTSSLLQPAAPRYSEIRLSELAKDIFKDLNGSLKWVDNYDGTEKIPEVLPIKFPMILHQAQEGIAVGMSSKIPSFNLIELNNATINFLENREVGVMVPDFATGGLIVNNKDAFESIRKNGKGSFKLRAKVEIRNNIISIIEIPYTTTREAIIDSIIKNIKSKNITEILDIKDLTGLNKMEIEITCKKNVDMDIFLEKLYHLTPMEDTYSCNMTVMYDGYIQTMGTEKIIGLWTDYRATCILMQKLQENEKIQKQIELCEGLNRILDKIDNVVETIINSPEDLMINNLIEKYSLTKAQAEYVANIKLKNLNKDYVEHYLKKLNDLNYSLDINKKIINSRKDRDNIIIAELKEINKKYGKERKTQIVEIDSSKVAKFKNKKEEIKDYAVKIVVTKHGYVKKIINDKGDQKLKANDYIVGEFNTTNLANLIVFSGVDCYKIKVSDLSVCKKSDFGDYIPGMLGIDDILGYSIDDLEYKFILVLYSNGKIAKISLDAYKTKSNRRKLTKSLNPDHKVLKILSFKEDQDFVLINYKGNEKIKNTNVLKSKSSKTTQGVNVLKNIIDIKYFK